MTTMRTGITTGTCAAAAAKAAAMLLTDCDSPSKIAVTLPDGGDIDVEILWARKAGDQATAAVRKDAGDDPDVTDGMEIVVSVSFAVDGDVTFIAGEGVGTVTKPGLQVDVDEPAINPVPRAMITKAVREITDRPVRVEVSIPGGEAVAKKTFNPRLGIEGGLSILGTTGIVRPYCRRAIADAISCALDVAKACGIRGPVLVPGNIGASGCQKHFRLADQQLIEVGNEWGFAIDALSQRSFCRWLWVGHPGKLAKLIEGYWYTHSSASPTAVGAVSILASKLGITPPDSETVDGLFKLLDAGVANILGDGLAGKINEAIAQRLGGTVAVGVMLVDMAGNRIGVSGDLSSWETCNGK